MEYFLKPFFSLIFSNIWKEKNQKKTKKTTTKKKKTTIKKKKRDKSKFSWITLFKYFLKIKMLSNMSEQEKKRQRIYHLLNAETKPQNSTK